MFKRILICTDLKDGMQRLVQFVPSLVASGANQIMFLHVIPLSSDRAVPQIDEERGAAARKRLAIAQSQIPEGTEVKVEVQYGIITERIQEMTRTYQPDVLVLGMSSHDSLLSQNLFGSTTRALCNQIKKPILLLRPQLISTYTNEELDLRCRHLFRYLLIPYDGSNVANYLLEQVKQFAGQRQPNSLAECLVCWVIEGGGRRDIAELLKQEATKKATALLGQVKTDLEAFDLTVTTQLFYGEPVPEVLLAAQEYDITAIALSSDGFGKLIELSVPSFAGEVMRRSWHPVLYFPHK